MQIILLDKIINLGGLGDQVNVKSGYARNFLIPKGKAVLANKKNIDFFKKRRAELEIKLANTKAEAELRAKKINELCNITIKSKVGNEGKLFGSIRARNIAEAITNNGISITKNEIILPNGALRTIGEYNINIRLYNDIFATLNVLVVPES